MGDSIRYIPGGKGANQAVAMAKLGAEAEMFGCLEAPVPMEIQLIGFDDVNFGKVFTPELTTVHQPIRKMGTVAAQIVECCVEGKDYEKHASAFRN